MDEKVINISVPDVVGLFEDEAKEILQKSGFTLRRVEITNPIIKGGQPEGGCRVVRQHTSGQDVELVLAFQKWVCC